MQNLNNTATTNSVRRELQLKKLIEKLPSKIPGHLLTKEEAEALDYKKTNKDQKQMFTNKIEINEAMVAFSASNIGYSEHRSLTGIRLEGLLLRLRYVIY